MQKNSELIFYSNCEKSQRPGRHTLSISEAGNILKRARISDCNFLLNGSNHVFLVTMAKGDMKFRAIYKPRRGEAPLWDFPDGTLYKREYAAFLVSQALEWYLIPPTVIRGGPLGIGSMQWFIDTARMASYDSQIKDTSILKQVALFDFLVNNADRKAGHFLEDRDGRLWVVDHGLTFNSVPKLRTVLWDFSGEKIPGDLLADVRVLQSKLRQEEHLRNALARLLEESELEALEFRINTILKKPTFVYPGPYRSVPWPWY